MAENLVAILAVVLLFLFRRPNTEGGATGIGSGGIGGFTLPPWLSKVLFVFSAIMLIRNVGDVLDLVFTEGDAWWPIVLSTAKELSALLRDFFLQMKEIK